VSTNVYSVDFAKCDETGYAKLSAAFDSLDVGVLGTPSASLHLHSTHIASHFTVNNVGKSHNMPVYFSETPKEEMNDIVAINVNATLHMTYAILPGMIQRYVRDAP